jgi:hypothetical protein
MKLLNRGSELSQRQKAWWVGELMVCQRCGQQVQLEYADQEALKEKVTHIQGAEISCPCPTCKNKMTSFIPMDKYHEGIEAAGRFTEEEFKTEIGNLFVE